MKAPLRPRWFSRLLFNFAACLLCPGPVQALTIDSGDVESANGRFYSAGIVTGRPAIIWLGETRSALKYSRAGDDTGNSWGEPVIVDSGMNVSGRMSLQIVQGHPAVCYATSSQSFKLKFTRALDPEGNAWAAPVLIQTFSFDTSSMRIEIVDGNPAILYTSGQYLNIVRATDPAGTSWGLPVPVASTSAWVWSMDLKVVDGNPAVVYPDTSGLYYVRATNAQGTAWGAKIKAGSLYEGHVSMQVVNGRPAIAFSSGGGSGTLSFVQAVDATGSQWQEPVVLDATVPDRGFTSLAIVNGTPAIAYQTPAPLDDLKYIQAKDCAATSWHPPVTVASTGKAGGFTTLMEVSGRPAMLYYDEARFALEYLRASDPGAEATAQWPPELVTEQPPGSALTFAAPAAFGMVPPGTAKTLPIALSNPNSGCATAVIQSASVTGPDAAEFSFLVSPVGASLAATQAVPFSIHYAPFTAGLKNATVLLEIATGGTLSTFGIPLTGNSAPDISLEFPSGSVLTETTPLVTTLTAPGRTRDLVFTFRNPGAAELSGLALTIDGPDASEFSLATPLPVSVAYGDSATFTVRHAPSTNGSKTATLHLASNVSGDKNPFDLTLKMRPGLTDPSFDPDIHASYALTAVAVEPGGSILAGGYDSLVRLHPDGSADSSLSSPAPDGQVKAIVVQKNGSILVAGDFIRWGDKEQHGVARLHVDGSLDESFAPAGMEHINCMAVQPDGKILLGGTRFITPSQPRRRLMRLLPDGSDDSSFDVTPDGDVLCVAVQPDGKILAGGRFTSLNGFAASRLARLNPDGTPDFFLSDFDERVNALAWQTDGKVVAGGFFATGQFEQGGAFFGRGIARLQPDGTRDVNYTFAMFDTVEVKSLAMQADGGCVVAGTYFVPGIGPSTRLMRFRTDGKLDPDFQMLTDGVIHSIALQPDGKALAVGEFFTAGGLARKRIVRVDNDFGSARLELTGTSALRWWRDGGAPEVQNVTFEVKHSDATAWVPLGIGIRIPGGWELTGLALPATGRFRARGTAGGSLMETVLSKLPPLEAWREQYFNSPANAGDGANGADPDRDGLTNLVEFAFGLSPVSRAGTTLPVFNHNGTALSVSFTAPAGRDSVLQYGVEASPSMLPGTWTAVSDTGGGGTHAFSISAVGDRRFVRFVIKVR